MLELKQSDCKLISAGEGCSYDGSCQSATLFFLSHCSFEQLQIVNDIFKQVILSDSMQGADSDTLSKALVAAIMDAQF